MTMATITVPVRFTAMLARSLELRSSDLVAFELEAGGTYGELLVAIGERFGERFPPNTWDPQARRFHPHVGALQHGTPLRDPAAVLQPDLEVTFLVGIAGG